MTEHLRSRFPLQTNSGHIIMRKLKSLFFVLFLLSFSIAVNAQKQSVDLIISGGTVVTMDSDKRLIINGAVAIKADKIVAVDTASELARRFSARQSIDAQNKAIIPGLVNTHTHIPMTLFRGISDDLDLQEWLTKYIFPAEAKNVNEKFVRAGTRLGLAEMIRGGTTAFCDMYYFEDAIADETQKAGVRGVLGETVIDFPVPDNKTWNEAMDYTKKFIGKWKNNPLITPAIAPHAPYTVSTEHLKEVKALSDSVNAPVVIHVAETKTEVADITAKYKARPIAYLANIGLLNDRTIAAHVVYADDAELNLLQKLGVGIAHNPQSNMKLASGVAPVPQMLRMNLPIGLGTDGAASNNDLDMWEEMDTAAKLHKVFTGDPKVVSAEQAFEMATIGGARALHLQNSIGSIEAGKRADIAVVDFDGLHQTPYYNVYSALVYSTKASDVRHVVINGKVIMRDRRLLTLKETEIKKDATAFRRSIIESLSK